MRESTRKSVAKRHHYVPLMILRKFVDRTGLLHCYRKDDQRSFAAKPEDVFVKKYLYKKSGPDIEAKERELATQIEGPTNPIVEKILARGRQGRLPRLTHDEKLTWDKFFCVQMRRTLDARAKIDDEELVRWALDSFEKRVGRLTVSEQDIFDTVEKRREAVDQAWIDILTVAQGEVFDALRAKGLLVLRLEDPDKSFVIGSVPILPMIPAGMTLDDSDASALFPIAHDVALACFGRDGNEEILILPKGTRGAEKLRQINLAIFNQSSMVASRSRALVESLGRRR